MTLIEDYIQKAPAMSQEKLTEMYHLLKPILKEAEEKLSYGMPTFYFKGNLLHFAPSKKHLGFYPTPSAITHFAKELTPYKTSKGAIQFPYETPLPKELIKKIALFRLEEQQNK